MYLGKCHAICALVSKVSDLIRAIFVFETMSFFFHSKVCVSITHYSELYWQVLPWKIQQQPCLLTWSFFCEASQYHECCCVLSNCIAGDIMIEHRLPKLIEACQSQHKLCSKCCSAACVKVTAPEPAITVNVGVVYDLIQSMLHL